MAQHIFCRLLMPIRQLTSKHSGYFVRYLSSDISSGDMYPSPQTEPWIPPYVERENEPASLKKPGCCISPGSVECSKMGLSLAHLPHVT
ncbi:uncharacterized protein LOC116925932 [Daphnia magna]|uniref:uncharacterized protein LOC116925932 n=1 Tax=Daphnia magna TaxID=35525 RepID=UPI001E1BC75D|nr:uncharacterized protein LOC116925932 [Daphnia magna]